jgi:hypothetical protein
MAHFNLVMFVECTFVCFSNCIVMFVTVDSLVAY